MTRPSDVPAALPSVWSKPGQTPTSGHVRVQSGATTVLRSTPQNAPSRIGRRGLAVIGESLSERDWQVLRSVAQHRYLATRHIETLHFENHATPATGARVCRRTLRRLAGLRVLATLERRIGGVRAGSAGYVWQVGPVGDRLLRQDSDHARTRTRQHEAGRLFLGHCLAVAEAHIALVQAQRRGELELVSVQTEPACWRVFTGLGGARISLQPDLYVMTGDPADSAFVNCWFVEVDRGTENPARLLAKCERYEAYRATGAEQADGDSFPIIVWAMSDERQVERLADAIARAAYLDHRLFRVTTAEGLLGVIRGGVA